MSTPAPDRSVRAASWAVAAVFTLSGVNFASWASRMPAIRDGLGFSPDRMGLLLLVASVGSLLSLPLSGMVVERLGARRTVMTFAVVNALGFLLSSVGVQQRLVPLVVAGLVLVGVGAGVWDASMNLEGALVEQRLGRTVMPRYHAGFSFGTMAAAGVAAVAAEAHVPVVAHLPAVMVVSTVLVAVAVRRFLPTGHADHLLHPEPVADVVPDADVAGPTAGSRAATAVVEHPVDLAADPAVSAPRGARGALAAWAEPRTLLVGLVVLAAALTEGAANDWASLSVVDGFRTSHAVGALAFGIFVTAMTAMRMFGTPLLDRFGRVAVLRLCAGLALVGLAVFGLVGPLWLAMVGIVAWGMGAALGFPVGMSAAADDPRRAPARVSVVSTIGYSAFLGGPPLLGLLAQHVGYRHALLAILVPVALSLAVMGAAAPLHRDRAQRDRAQHDRAQHDRA